MKFLRLARVTFPSVDKTFKAWESRIADLATNIAEDVVYMVDGELIRHRVEDYQKEYK
jgi:phosphate uptake regulator